MDDGSRVIPVKRKRSAIAPSSQLTGKGFEESPDFTAEPLALLQVP